MDPYRWYRTVLEMITIEVQLAGHKSNEINRSARQSTENNLITGVCLQNGSVGLPETHKFFWGGLNYPRYMVKGITVVTD